MNISMLASAKMPLGNRCKFIGLLHHAVVPGILRSQLSSLFLGSNSHATHVYTQTIIEAHVQAVRTHVHGV